MDETEPKIITLGAFYLKPGTLTKTERNGFPSLSHSNIPYPHLKESLDNNQFSSSNYYEM